MRTYALNFPPIPGPIPLDRLSDGDRAELRKLAAGKSSIIEIGTFLGGSAETMLEASDAHMVCVDTFRGTAGNETAEVKRSVSLQYTLMRLDRFPGRVSVMVADSLSAARMIGDGTADLIFLDADHSYDAVKADIAAWRPKLKPGGVFAGHDMYKWHADVPPERMEAVKHLQADPETGIHCGVHLAVTESFDNIELLGGVDSSVWCARSA